MTKSLNTILATAILATTFSGTAFAKLPGFLNRTVDISLAAVQVHERCFEEPNRSRIMSEHGRFKGRGIYTLEKTNYERNLRKYSVCQLRTTPQRIVAAGEMSKFSLVELASALDEIQAAFNLKQTKLRQIAERAKASSGYDIDYQDEYNALSAEIAKMKLSIDAMENTEHPPEVIIRVAKADARIKAASEYAGQSIGTSTYLLNEFKGMSESQREAMIVSVVTTFDYDVSESKLTDSLASMTLGFAQSVSGIFRASHELAEVAEESDYDLPKKEIADEYETTKERAEDVLSKVGNNQPI